MPARAAPIMLPGKCQKAAGAKEKADQGDQKGVDDCISRSEDDRAAHIDKMLYRGALGCADGKGEQCGGGYAKGNKKG